MKKSTKSPLTRKAVKALNDAVAKVVEDHRRHGKSLAVWRGGKAVWVSVSNSGAPREKPIPHKRVTRGGKGKG
jgi:hypothetical protein